MIPTRSGQRGAGGARAPGPQKRNAVHANRAVLPLDFKLFVALQVEAVGLALGQADHRNDQLADLVAVGGYRQLVEQRVEAGVQFRVSRAGPAALAVRLAVALALVGRCR